MGLELDHRWLKARMTTAVTYENSEIGFGSLRTVKAVDHVIYISDTDMVEGHR
jgi:hypothetical protein